MPADDLIKVTVRGRGFKWASDIPIQQPWIFSPNYDGALVDGTADDGRGIIFDASPLKIVPDVTGYLEVDVPSVADSSGNPTGYTIKVQDPTRKKPYNITPDHTLITPDPVNGKYYYNLKDVVPPGVPLAGDSVLVQGGISQAFADAHYVTTAAIAGKADTTALTSETSARTSADATLTSSLAAKADAAATTTALGLKADATALTSGLAAKADATALTSEVSNRIAAVAAKADSLTGVTPSRALTNGSDQASAINAELTALASVAGTLQLPAGAITINSPISVPAGVTLRGNSGTIITNTVATTSAVILAAGSALIGGSINSPATFDGTTGGTWTYAVVYITGAGAAVSGVTFNNVPHIGIGIKDTDDAVIVGCRIFGNYPSASFTGTETAHFGINLDPGTSTTGGNMVVGQNIIKTCVQGTFIGNHGAGGSGRGVAIVGNVYESCWNHGVYADQGEGYTITGNAFNRCQNPVVVSGNYHTVMGNTMTTASTGTGADEPQISVRDAIGCVVSGNTLQGEANGSTGVMIDVRELVGVVLRDNIIANNIVDVTGSTGATAIRCGAGGATTMENNSISGNHVRSAGVSLTALLSMNADPTILGVGNKVTDNTIVIAGPCYGVTLSHQQHCDVRGNHIRLEYNAGSATTLGGVVLTASSVKNRVKHNDFVCSASFGTNITWRCVWEVSASGAGTNRVGPNDYDLDPTLVTGVPLLLISGSGTIIDESGAGAPTAACAVGSTWRRTDGGASTTFYVKESLTTSSGWNATSTAGAVTPTNVQTFTTVGTTSWTKPAGAVIVRAEVIGGGSGGGSGRRGAAASVRCGGGGGGGASRSDAMINASDLPSTVTVVVGAAGTGGAAQTVDSTDGNVGGTGGDSRFGDTTGGIQVYARVGNPGAAGTASIGSGGAVSIGMFPGASGGSASTTGLVGVAAGATGTTGGGGSGGGITSADAASAGGTGSVSSFSNIRTVTAAGTVGAGQNGAAGSAAPAAGMGGDGGGGGASSITGAAGTGGAGGIYGAGGGGGGASLNGNNSGAGGAGGAGFVRVTTYF